MINKKYKLTKKFTYYSIPINLFYDNDIINNRNNSVYNIDNFNKIINIIFNEFIFSKHFSSLFSQIYKFIINDNKTSFGKYSFNFFYVISNNLDFCNYRYQFYKNNTNDNYQLNFYIMLNSNIKDFIRLKYIIIFLTVHLLNNLDENINCLNTDIENLNLKCNLNTSSLSFSNCTIFEKYVHSIILDIILPGKIIEYILDDDSVPIDIDIIANRLEVSPYALHLKINNMI